jgi:hypothetical protein
MLKAEVQMAEEKKTEKIRPNNKLAERLKWPKTENSPEFLKISKKFKFIKNRHFA